MSQHYCHAEGCEKGVPPRMFMCVAHWMMLPKPLRDAVWAEYIPGQEIRKDPTEAYLNVTRRAINFIAVKEGRREIVAGDAVAG